MTTPAIITVAITGAIPRKADTPAVPVTPSEQIESTQEAFEAGASVAHIHVRNPRRKPQFGSEAFRAGSGGHLKHCPKMIVQFSTGGRGRSQNERGRMLYLKPDMASLATGSVNFPAQIYENPPQLVEDLARSMLEYSVKPEIEVFDAAMLYNARIMVDLGLLKTTLPGPIRNGHSKRAASPTQPAGISDRGTQGADARCNVVGRRDRTPSA